MEATVADDKVFPAAAALRNGEKEAHPPPNDDDGIDNGVVKERLSPTSTKQPSPASASPEDDTIPNVEEAKDTTTEKDDSEPASPPPPQPFTGKETEGEKETETSPARPSTPAGEDKVEQDTQSNSSSSSSHNDRNDKDDDTRESIADAAAVVLDTPVIKVTEESVTKTVTDIEAMENGAEPPSSSSKSPIKEQVKENSVEPSSSSKSPTKEKVNASSPSTQDAMDEASSSSPSSSWRSKGEEEDIPASPVEAAKAEKQAASNEVQDDRMDEETDHEEEDADEKSHQEESKPPQEGAGGTKTKQEDKRSPNEEEEEEVERVKEAPNKFSRPQEPEVEEDDDDEDEDVIECPLVQDILVGMGQALKAHPGNQRMVAIIAVHRDRYDAADQKRKKRLVKEVISEVSRGGTRFLKVNESGTGWIQCSSKEIKGKGTLFDPPVFQIVS